MRLGTKAALLGSVAVGVGAAACWRWQFRVSLKEFTRYALYMAVLDDEICRNELEGCTVGEEVLCFPPKSETLQGRYHFFLQRNRGKSRRQLNEELVAMEHRLQDSREVADQPKGAIELVVVSGRDEKGSAGSSL